MFWGFSFTILYLIADIDAACYSTESCLYDSLMADYNNEVRPVAGPTGTVDVSISLSLQNILGLEDRNEVLDSVLEITAVWSDRFLTWDTVEYGVGSILLNVKKIWLPDIAITNSVEQFYQRTFLEDFRAEINSNGEVRWRFGGIFKTTCSMDITRYPFDVQTCTVVIENWSYSASSVNLTNGEVITTYMEVNALWSLTSSSVTYSSFSSRDLEFPRLTFSFILKRKTSYYMFNLLIPCMFIMCAALGLFWLPPDCGEKISLGITVLLAFSVFQIVIMESTPVNSEEIPFISDLVMTIMSMATVSVMSAMLSSYLYFKGPEYRVPKWLRVVAFKYVAKLVFLKSEVRALEGSVFPTDEDTAQNLKIDDVEKKRMDSASLKPKNELEAILKKLDTITDMIIEKQKDEFVTNEWKLLAKVIDRLLFWITVILILIIILSIVPY